MHKWLDFMSFQRSPIVRSFFEYAAMCTLDPAFPLVGLICVCASKHFFVKDISLIQGTLTMHKVCGVVCSIFTQCAHFQLPLLGARRQVKAAEILYMQSLSLVAVDLKCY